ncbi:MAG: hypothetical protein J6N15_00765 [Ruminiclostridium sp.]|nr:hypothetical protein [Ruminiclostridium sp.]
MRREELVMDILGGLDDSFIEEAMPRTGKYAVSDSAAAAAPITLVETGTEISKKDLRIYWITRALGMAAVVALIVGAVVLLVQNWDKIAVSGNERPGVVTTVSDTAITSSSYEITCHEVTPRMEAAWKLTNDYMYGLLFTITGDEVKDTMKDSCGAEPSSITPFEVPENAEEAILYIYENMPFFSYNADMGAVVSVTRGLTQVDYTIEAKSETDANTVYEDIKDKLEEMLGQPDISDDTYCSWDVMETGICFDLRKQPNDQVKFFMYNKYISGTKDDNLFEQITDTSMPEPYDSMEYPLGNFDFYSLWQAKLFGADQIVHFDYEKKNEYRKLVEGIETPYTLYDSPNFYGMARTMELTDDEITEAIKTINEHFENTINLLNNTSYIYNEEDIAVIKNADDSVAAQHFASEYSVVVGENVFSPKWLYYHTIEDYKAVGIDPYSMHSLLEKYSELGLSEEAWRAFRRKLILYAYSEMYPEKDRVYTYELDVSEPLGGDAFRIFEDMFCGEWEYAGKYDRHNATFDMTYGGTSFKFGRLFGIFETEDIYVIHYSSSGGTLECYVIEKSSPNVMYNTDVLTSLGGIEEIKLGDDELVKYINRKPAAAELKPGDLSIPGLTYLFHLYGSDFEEYYRAVIDRDGYQSISEDEPLYISYGYTADEYRRYLVDMSENSVTIALPYVHDNRDTNQTSVYYELTFTKDESGEWSVTYNRSGEVYFYERADSKTYTGDTPDYYEGLLPELEMRDVLRVGESLSFRSAVVTLRAPDGKVRASCPFASGMVGLSGYSCTAMREPLVKLFNLENRRILIAVGLPLWESEFDRSYLTSFYLYDGDPILRRLEADGDYLEVIVKDSTSISPGEDGTVYCTQPDGLILEYHIGENGHAALTPSQYD